MDRLKEFLKKDGYSPDLIDSLIQEEAPEGFEVDTEIGKLQEVRFTLFQQGKGKGLMDDAVRSAKVGYMNSEKARLNKLLGMGLSRRETDEIAIDDFNKLASSFLDDKYKELQAQTDEELKSEVSNWRTKFQEKVKEFDDLSSSTEKAIEDANRAAEKKINEFHIDRYFDKLRDSKEWARDQDKEPGHFFIKAKIAEKFQVAPDGTITNTDGTKAVNFEDNGIYTKVDEPYEYLFKKYSFAKQSLGDTGMPIVDGVVVSDKLTDNAAALIERARNKRRNL